MNDDSRIFVLYVTVAVGMRIQQFFLLPAINFFISMSCFNLLLIFFGSYSLPITFEVNY